MAEEIVTIEPDIEVPDGLKASFEDISEKFSKLAQTIYGNMDITQLRSQIVKTRLNDGEVNVIRHRLNREVKAILLFSGRVLYHKIVRSNNQSVSIIPSLASTYFLPSSNRFTNRIEVGRASIFRVGDSVRIGSDIEAVVENIADNTLTLSKKIYSKGLTEVALSVEFAQFLLV